MRILMRESPVKIVMILMSKGREPEYALQD
jgi:hypothetical protein